MATRLRFKLPPLKVTQWSSAGDTTHRTIPRCFSSSPNLQTISKRKQGGKNDPSDLEDSLPPAAIDDTLPLEELTSQTGNGSDAGPSLYSVKERSAAKEWEAIRPQLLKCAVESSAMPHAAECILCQSPATMRCLKCGPRVYFCIECFGDLHKKINILHTGEVWEVYGCMSHNYLHACVHVIHFNNNNFPSFCISLCWVVRL